MDEIKTYQHKVGEKLRLSEDSIPDAEFVTVNLERAEFKFWEICATAGVCRYSQRTALGWWKKST